MPRQITSLALAPIFVCMLMLAAPSSSGKPSARYYGTAVHYASNASRLVTIPDGHRFALSVEFAQHSPSSRCYDNFPYIDIRECIPLKCNTSDGPLVRSAATHEYHGSGVNEVIYFPCASYTGFVHQFFPGINEFIDSDVKTLRIDVVLPDPNCAIIVKLSRGSHKSAFTESLHIEECPRATSVASLSASNTLSCFVAMLLVMTTMNFLY